MKTMKLAVFLIAAASAGMTFAHTVQYGASLLGAAEAPPNASPGTGTALITIDYDLLTMDVNVNFSGLLGNTSAAHIHCCTAVAETGTAGVATTTPSFPGFPSGVTSGSYHQVFDLTQASSYNATFITNNGGTVSGALNALSAGLDAGKAYFNIHTSFAPGGEIRGFLAPVPIPAAAWLFGTAIMGLPLLRRR